MRKRIEVLFYKNHFEPRAEEEWNHSRTSGEREYYSKISYKRKGVSIHEEFQTSHRRGKEYRSSQLLRISSGREFELQSSPKILNIARNRGRISGIIVMKILEWVKYLISKWTMFIFLFYSRFVNKKKSIECKWLLNKTGVIWSLSYFRFSKMSKEGQL